MDTTMTAHDAASGLPTHYGVAVCSLGEDGDRMLAFTDNPRRALAAMNRQVRDDCGVGEMVQQFDPDVRVRWAVFHDTCGCVHDDPSSCRADLNGAVTCCVPDPEDDSDPVEKIADHGCPRPGLPPCTRGDGDWWMSTTDITAATPNAVQVCLVNGL